MISEQVDLVIIGGGPAGYAAALQAAKVGARIALVERRRAVDGLFRQTGTVPGITLREAVLNGSFLQGEIPLPDREIRAADLSDRINRVLIREMRIKQECLERNGVRFFHGQGVIEEARRVAVVVGDEVTHRLETDRIIIATGTIPQHLPDIPYDREVVFDVDFIFSPENRRGNLPSSIIVIGAGIIGAEYASVFGHLGRRVTLVERRHALFDFADPTVVRQLIRRMEEKNIELLLGAEFTAVGRTPAGKGRVEMSDGRALEAEAVLIATGRRANTAELNLAAVGIEVDARGLILVDQDFRTSVPHIFAVGDVIGFPALSSTSGEQGRTAVSRALDQPRETSAAPQPFTIHTIPEISMVGMTEQILEEKSLPYAAGTAFYRALPKALLAGEETGLLKLLFHPESKRLYGVHVIGAQAAELIHLGQAAIAAKLPVEYFADAVFNHPSYSEIYREAALNGLASIRS